VFSPQFIEGDSAESLGLDGHEAFTIGEFAGNGPPYTVGVSAQGPKRTTFFTCRVRIDTPKKSSTTATAASCNKYVVRQLAA